MSLLPLYALHIGGNNTDAGLITGVFTVSALLFRPVFGALLDHNGRKIVLMIGIIIIILVSLSYNFTYTINSLLLFRMLNGIGFSAGTTAISTVVADTVPITRLVEGFGYYGISNTIAQAIGPLFGLYIIQQSGYNALFDILSVMSISSMTCAFFLRYKKNIPKTERRDTNTNIGKKPNLNPFGFIETATIAPALVMLFATTSIGSVQTFLAKYAMTRGINDIGLFFTVFAFSAMAARIVLGNYNVRLGFGRILVSALISLLMSQVILVFATQLFVFLIAAVFYGLGHGIVLPSLNTIIVLLASKNRKGAANAVYYSAMDTGIGVGAVIWGIVSQAYGLHVIYLASASCCLIAIIIYHLLLHNRLKNYGKDGIISDNVSPGLS